MTVSDSPSSETGRGKWLKAQSTTWCLPARDLVREAEVDALADAALTTSSAAPENRVYKRGVTALALEIEKVTLSVPKKCQSMRVARAGLFDPDVQSGQLCHDVLSSCFDDARHHYLPGFSAWVKTKESRSLLRPSRSTFCACSSSFTDTWC
jgi:hypothetical protein